MEEPQQPDHPVSTQPDGEAVQSEATPPPADAEQETSSTELKQNEEKSMDHLTVISESSETSESIFNSVLYLQERLVCE